MNRALRCFAAWAALVSVAAAKTPAPISRGETLYKRTCVYCHDQNGWGTRDLARRVGPENSVLTKRKDLQRAYVHLVVRRGLGNMPAFTPTDLSAADIDDIADYLKASPRRKAPKRKR